MTKKELEQRVQELESKNKVYDTLLRYIAFKWIVESQDLARRILEIKRFSSTKRKNSKISELWETVKGSKDLMKMLNSEGVSMPIDENVFQIVAENTVSEVEVGKNGMMFSLRRPALIQDEEVDDE